MKRMLVLMLALAMVFALCACDLTTARHSVSESNKLPASNASAELTEEALKGTWKASVPVKERIESVCQTFFGVNEDLEGFESVVEIVEDTMPADLALEYLLVFDGTKTYSVVDIAQSNDTLHKMYNAMISEEVLLEIFRVQNLSEKEIHEFCGGFSVAEYVKIYKELLESVDLEESYAQSGYYAIRNGYAIAISDSSDSYRIEGNRAYVISDGQESYLEYDGSTLALTEAGVLGAVDSGFVDAMLPLKLTKISSKTDY